MSARGTGRAGYVGRTGTTPTPRDGQGRTPEVARYRAHGYLIAVPDGLDLPLPRLSAPDGDGPHGDGDGDGRDGLDGPDVLRVGVAPPVVVPQEAPPGTVVAALAADAAGPADAGPRFYTFTVQPDALHLRFHAALDLVGDAGLTRCTVTPDPSAPPGLVSVALAGTVLAVRLMLDGRLALHAGAVADRRGVVAFAGPSGSGKSTLTALGVLAGAQLVTDDVLRVDLDPDGGGPQVWPGATALRLREGAAGVGQALAELAGRTGARTADGRIAVPVREIAPGPQRLRCVVLADLDDTVGELDLVRLNAFEALRRLVAAPRVVGWCAPAQLRRQFHQLADLCERVPVVAVRIPLGARDDPGLVADLLDRLPG